MFNAYLLVITEEVPSGLEPVPPPLPLSPLHFFILFVITAPDLLTDSKTFIISSVVAGLESRVCWLRRLVRLVLDRIHTHCRLLVMSNQIIELIISAASLCSKSLIFKCKHRCQPIKSCSPLIELSRIKKKMSRVRECGRSWWIVSLLNRDQVSKWQEFWLKLTTHQKLASLISGD